MEDKYTFETTNSREMDLVVNRTKMLLTLNELKDWYRSLYNGKCYDTSFVCNGKLYTHEEFNKATDLPTDKNGFVKDYKEVYEIDNVLKRIDEILGDMYEFVERNMY